MIERNPLSWSVIPKIGAYDFALCRIDHRSLELEKGSGDAVVNALPVDPLTELAKRPNLLIEDVPGTQVQYLAFNLRDPLLKMCAYARRLPSPSTAS